MAARRIRGELEHKHHRLAVIPRLRFRSPSARGLCRIRFWRCLSICALASSRPMPRGVFERMTPTRSAGVPVRSASLS